MSWRTASLSFASQLVLGAGLLFAADDRPDLSGKWRFVPSGAESGIDIMEMLILIEDRGDTIHFKETRGPDLKDDVSEFTCGKMGKQCDMQDGKEKARVSVYYNGPALVVLKTHGRKGCSVEKRRYSFDPAANALTVELERIEPEGKPVKLVLAKAP